MNRQQMIARTKQLALRVLKLVDALPSSHRGRAMADQLSRCGTSVGANYRAAGRGRSKAEFISKLGIAEEEADETCYFLELVIESKMLPKARVLPLLNEADEVLRIIAASRITAKSSPRTPTKHRTSNIADRT